MASLVKKDLHSSRKNTIINRLCLVLEIGMLGGSSMKAMRDVIVILSMMSVCVSCAMFGKSKEYHGFNASWLESFTPGTTTAAEVLEVFGAPSHIVKLSNGNAYVYERSVSKGTGVWLVILSFGNYETQYDRVVFFFDDEDILTHYGLSMNAGDSSYGLPF
jgi:hypothetical protein